MLFIFNFSLSIINCQLSIYEVFSFFILYFSFFFPEISGGSQGVLRGISGGSQGVLTLWRLFLIFLTNKVVYSSPQFKICG